MPFDLMDDGDSEEFGAGFAELLDFSFVVSATLPGQPVEHNADRADSGCSTSTFHWDVVLSDPRQRLMAESDGTDECGGGEVAWAPARSWLWCSSGSWLWLWG